MSSWDDENDTFNETPITYQPISRPITAKIENYPHFYNPNQTPNLSNISNPSKIEPLKKQYIYNIAKFKVYNEKSRSKKTALADYFKLWIQSVLDANLESKCKYISLTLPFTYKQLPVGACKIQWESWSKDSNILYRELFSNFSRLPRGIMLSTPCYSDRFKEKTTSLWHFSNNSLHSIDILNKLDYLIWDNSKSSIDINCNDKTDNKSSIHSIIIPTLDDYVSKKRLFNIKDYKDYEIIIYKLEPELDMYHNYTPLKQYLQLFIRYKLATGIQSLKNIDYELPFTYKELMDYKLGYIVKWNDWQDNNSVIIYELFKPIILNYPIELICSRTISLIQKPENMKWYFISNE